MQELNSLHEDLDEDKNKCRVLSAVFLSYLQRSTRPSPNPPPRAVQNGPPNNINFAQGIREKRSKNYFWVRVWHRGGGHGAELSYRHQKRSYVESSIALWGANAISIDICSMPDQNQRKFVLNTIVILPAHSVCFFCETPSISSSWPSMVLSCLLLFSFFSSTASRLPTHGVPLFFLFSFLLGCELPEHH